MKYLQMHAVFSKGRRYRYTLRRRLYKGNKILLVIGLNPSTADGKEDDPTVRRCAGFVERLGYDTLLMVNLFALCSTDPRKLREAEFPIGPRNDPHVDEKLIS